MKKLTFLLPILFISSFLYAGADRQSTTDPSYIEGGNKWLVREVKMSTGSPVIISSVPASAGLGISKWRKRIIVNISTCAALGLYPSNTTNTSYDYSNGLTLSSMTTSMPIQTVGNTIVIDHQGEINGIWADSGTDSSAAQIAVKRGALVYEQYEK